MRTGQERGSATVVVLVLMAVLGALAAGGAVAGSLLVGQRRAAAAADLAALAGAEALAAGGGSTAAGPGACDAAEHVADRNGARLTGCLAEGFEAAIEVAVDVPNLFGGPWSIPGRARAGPAGTWGMPR